MENASKALIIAGAILISILIIAIGMYIYSSSTGSINSAISSMDTQEIEAFNSMWTSYEGTQTGTQVKALINKLIGNANTYQDEEAKVIGLSCTPKKANNTAVNVIYNATAANALTNFINELNNLYTSIEAKHNYTVTFDFQGTELIRKINIAY